MPDNAHVLEGRATPETIRTILAEMREYLLSLGLTEDTCGTVEIAIAEALNNIVEHAYGPIGEGPVRLEIRLLDDRLQIDLRDSGEGLPGLVLPRKDLPAACVARNDLPEGGFGWFLIHEMTAALHYRRVGLQNQLRLEFAVHAQDFTPWVE